MDYGPHPAFQALFSTFTADPNSIGMHLTGQMAQVTATDPMLVSTGSDIVIFPGGGQPPRIESFRRTTRGFIELTAVSHLGLAVAWIARLRELGAPDWRADIHRLTLHTAEVRAVNTVQHWRDSIAVAAWVGLEAKIVDMVEYSCAVTEAFLAKCLADEAMLTPEVVRTCYLDPVASPDVPVPINDMMVATFALVFLDIASRIMAWLRAQSLDWRRLMILISGQSGRPTAGLTWATNNMCHLLWQASEQAMSPERLYIAPHAAPFVLDETQDAQYPLLEAQYRQLWLNTRASVEMGRTMFVGYPAYQPEVSNAPYVSDTTRTLQHMPAITSLDDRRGLITRLRFVMEDPGQLISNAAAHFMIDELCACGNDPAKVTIPCFSGVSYKLPGLSY